MLTKENKRAIKKDPQLREIGLEIFKKREITKFNSVNE